MCLRAVFAVTIASFAGHLSAQLADMPVGNGIVYNVKENSALTYSCSALGTALECDFTQAAVRQAAKPEELSDMLVAGRREFAGGVKLNAEQCATYDAMVGIFEGRVSPPKPEALAALTPVERRDALAMARTMLTYCKSPSETNWLAIVRSNHDRKMRTCNVSSNMFKQTFRRGGDGKTWIVETAPSGPCGFINVDRFEPATTDSAAGKLTFWKYFARRVITNPNANFYGAVKCSALDQAEYEYDWKDRDRQLSCDYVQFTPF